LAYIPDEFLVEKLVDLKTEKETEIEMKAYFISILEIIESGLNPLEDWSRFIE